MYQPTKLPDADPQTKPADPLTLEALAAWLKTKPANKKYCYLSNGECLLAQYFRHAGINFDSMGASHYIASGCIKHLPYKLNQIAVHQPHTFGAALARTRAEIARRIATDAHVRPNVHAGRTP